MFIKKIPLFTNVSHWMSCCIVILAIKRKWLFLNLIFFSWVNIWNHWKLLSGVFYFVHVCTVRQLVGDLKCNYVQSYEGLRFNTSSNSSNIKGLSENTIFLPTGFWNIIQKIFSSFCFYNWHLVVTILTEQNTDLCNFSAIKCFSLCVYVFHQFRKSHSKTSKSLQSRL